jgi:hypothetical protein
MRLLPALISATLVAGVTTAVVAQTAPVQTNPNTKVYAYKKTAPAQAIPAPSAYAGATQPDYDRMPPDVPQHGSQQWWQEKNRFNGGDGGG